MEEARGESKGKRHRKRDEREWGLGSHRIFETFIKILTFTFVVGRRMAPNDVNVPIPEPVNMLHYVERELQI